MDHTMEVNIFVLPPYIDVDLQVRNAHAGSVVVHLRHLTATVAVAREFVRYCATLGNLESCTENFNA